MKMQFDPKTQPNERQRVHQSDILPKAVKQRHIEAWIVFSGVAADLPDGSTEVKAYYATDTDVLYLWDGSAWQSH